MLHDVHFDASPESLGRPMVPSIHNARSYMLALWRDFVGVGSFFDVDRQLLIGSMKYDMVRHCTAKIPIQG